MTTTEMKNMLKKLSDMKDDLEDMGNKIEDMKDEYEEGTVQEENIQRIVDSIDSANDKLDEVIRRITLFKA